MIGRGKVRRDLTVSLVVLLGLISAVLIGALVANSLAPRVAGIVVESESTLGGRGNIWAAVIMTPVIFAWLVSLVKSRVVISVGLLMVAFPLLGRVRSIFGVTIYQLADGWVEYLGLTSLCIVVLFLVFLLRRVPMRRPSSKVFRVVEACLWLFAGFGTLAQLIHHEPGTAFLLSFNGLWQYLLWFYVVTGAVRSTNDILSLFAWFGGMLMTNIVLRGLFTGVLYDPSWAEGGYYAVRFYASGLGWAQNYSILLAIGIIFNVGLLSAGKGRKAWVLWLALSAIQMIELLFTFTRGAYLAWALSLLFLLAWPGTRRASAAFLAILVLGLLSAVFAWSDLVKLVFGARIVLVPEDLVRWELFLLSIPDVLHDGGLGFGIFKEPTYYASWSRMGLPSHNFVLTLAHSVGLWSALAWLGALLTTMFTLTQRFRYRAQTEIATLEITLFVALLAWFAFGNVTGPGITGYYPVEATATIYTLMALGVAVCSSSVDNARPVSVQNVVCSQRPV